MSTKKIEPVETDFSVGCEHCASLREGQLTFVTPVSGDNSLPGCARGKEITYKRLKEGCGVYLPNSDQVISRERLAVIESQTEW